MVNDQFFRILISLDRFFVFLFTLDRSEGKEKLTENVIKRSHY